MLDEVIENEEFDDEPVPTTLAQLPQEKEIRITAETRTNCFRREPPKKKRSANAKLPPVSANRKRGTGVALARITEGASEVRVTVAVTGFPLPPRVTVEGLMLHVIPGGTVDDAGQASAMSPVKFKIGVTVIVPEPEWPAVSEIFAGELAIVKSGFPIFMMTAPPELVGP